MILKFPVAPESISAGRAEREPEYSICISSVKDLGERQTGTDSPELDERQQGFSHCSPSGLESFNIVGSQR